MSETFILLPSRDPAASRLVRAPEDFSERDAMRHLTALIGEWQEAGARVDDDALLQTLEDHGFTPLPLLVGPPLD